MTTIAPFRRSRYDALVVGARPAGAATALLLARAGLDVLLVDRQDRGADTLSTHALMRGAVLLLDRWGLLRRVIREGAPAITSTTFRYGGEDVTIPIKPGDGIDALRAPRRTSLDPILADAARDAGAEVRHGVAFVEAARDAGGRVRGAVLKLPDGSQVRVDADLLVGADGLGSSVARRVGARMLATGRVSTATVYAYLPDPGASAYRWLYRDGVGAGVIPTNGAQSCVSLSVPTARYDAEVRHDPAGAYARLLGAVDADLGRMAAFWAPADLKAFRGRPGFLREAAGPGWALVGDASFFRDPLTAHGVTDALREAARLAAAVVRGGAEAMSAYAAGRDALARRMLDVTDAVAACDWTYDALKAHHRRLSALMKEEVRAILADGGDPAEPGLAVA